MGMIINPYRFGSSSLLTGLVAWWSLDETSGTRADSHNSYDLSVVTGTGSYAAGVVANAFDTDVAGTPGTLGITDAAAEWTDIADTTMTFCGWVKLRVGTGNDGLWGKWGGGQNSYLLWTGTNTIKWGYTVDTAACTVSQTPGTWYFVEAYHDADANEMGLSLNRGTYATKAVPSGFATSTAGFAVGTYQYGLASLVSDSLIDELAAWSRRLTTDELDELYNSGSGIAYPG